MSLREFAAAIWPKVKGSSAMGVRKSTVWTRAISSERRYTPASSLVSKPTSKFGSFGRGRRRSTESKRPGLNFAAQPAALAADVKRTGSAKADALLQSFLQE